MIFFSRSLGFGNCQGAACGGWTPGTIISEPKILQTTAPGLPVVACPSSTWANDFCLAVCSIFKSF